MKRRDFSMAVLAGAGMLTLPVGAWAQEAGKDYLVLPKPAQVLAKPPKIEVVEFFSYGCVHCMNFEPQFEKWIGKQSDDVVIRREHVGFNAAFEPLQRLFYALEAMDKLKDVHHKVFVALQTDRVRLDQEAVAVEWVAKQGVDKAKFQVAYKSFSVASKIKQVQVLQQAYAVEGTPALGIAGKYYIDPTRARGFGGMLAAADKLIAQERAAKK